MVSGTAAALNENEPVKEMEDFWEKAPQLKDGPPGLSCFAQRRNILLKQGHVVLEGFADRMQAPERV